MRVGLVVEKLDREVRGRGGNDLSLYVKIQETSPNVVLMLAHRLRRWANIITTLGYVS